MNGEPCDDSLFAMFAMLATFALFTMSAMFRQGSKLEVGVNV